MIRIAAAKLSGLDPAELLAAGDPMVIVDLDGDDCPSSVPLLPGTLLVGVTHGSVPALAQSLDLTLAKEATNPWGIAVPDVEEAAATIARAVAGSPRAAATLGGLLRQAQQVDVRQGLYAESLAYSMLLAGPEHQSWLRVRRRRPVPAAFDPVLVERNYDRLVVTLNRPDRRNAFGHQVRDALVDALDLPRLDDSITDVVLRGAGPAFCSGGDLDEFGDTPDVVTAHLIRLERSVGSRIHALQDKVHAQVHGACVGAGVELPSFAGRVTACRDSFFQLPELAMGLVPGAGGTVSITRRIGRWRCAFLALSGIRLEAETALSWGLIDEISDSVSSSASRSLAG